eukprot:277363_1
MYPLHFIPGRSTTGTTTPQFIPDPKGNDIALAAERAVEQIRFYFSTANLAQDLYIRSHFDKAGFVPISFLASFPVVVNTGAPYHSILSRLSTVPELEEFPFSH